MKKLAKVKEPQILLDKARDWTNEYVSAVLAGVKPLPSKWRHEEIKSSLEEETFSRCAYCDSRMMAVTTGHIEHIIPRAKRPELVVAWENLTLACPRCNLAKSDYYDEDEPLLNPYVDDPEDHLVFVGDMVFPALTSPKGTLTVHKLKLYRADLTEARRRRIEQIASMVATWSQSTGQLREALAETIRTDVSEGEYEASVRSYLDIVGFPYNTTARSGDVQGISSST